MTAQQKVIENNFLHKIVVYPNPTNGNVSIKLGEIKTEIEMSLRNTLGQFFLTKSIEVRDHFNINMDKHQAGLNFLKLESPSGDSRIIKILKE